MGNPVGIACCLLPNEENSQEAVKQKQRQMLGTRPVSLKQMNVKFFQNFETNKEIIDREMLKDFITEENVSRSV